MIRYLLGVCFLVIALAASGIVASTGASAHPAASSLRVQSAGASHLAKPAIPAAVKTAALPRRAMHKHGTQGDDCTGNGSCCDSYCHPFVLSAAPDSRIARASRVAPLTLRNDVSPGANQDGQDRPPRPVAA